MIDIFYLAATRADFSPLSKTLMKIEKSKKFRLNILFLDFSINSLKWYQDIKSNFSLSSEKSIPCSGSSRRELIEATYIITETIGNSLLSRKTDLVLILGDRHEQMLLSTIAFSLGVRIVHLHGGEISGSIDDKYRTGISNFASLHLVSCQDARQKLISTDLACHENVKLTGAPGLEDIEDMARASNEEIKYALVAFHPDVLQIDNSAKYFDLLLSALTSRFEHVYCILGNSDPGSLALRNIAQRFVSNMDNFTVIEHLERSQYLNLLERATLFAGNSSSGIIEAASLQTTFLNLGTRQEGRYRNKSTFDWDFLKDYSLDEAIERALAFEGPWDNIYYQKGASSNIIKHLIEFVSE